MPVGERHQYSDYADCAICGETTIFYQGHELEDCLLNLVKRIEALEKKRGKK